MAADDPGRTWKEADSDDDRWNRTQVGPFLASVMHLPHGVSEKAVTIRIGDEGQGAMCFDTGRLIMRAGWHGGFLKFNSRRFGFTTAPAPAVEKLDWVTDSENGIGNTAARYRGLYLHGKRVVLEYEATGAVLRETPWLHMHEDIAVFRRTLEIGPHAEELRLNLAATEKRVSEGEGAFAQRRWTTGDGRTHTLTVLGTGEYRLEAAENRIRLVLPPNKETLTLRIDRWAANDDAADQPLLAIEKFPQDDIAALVSPGEPLWPHKLTAASSLAENDDTPYVVDTIGVPFENPYGALFFLSGHDFLSTGELLVSALHGDVWLVRGIDAKLESVTWKRFATGLHQPFGVKVVDDRIYVLGKDQITRLEDRNGDGEADCYENFNNHGVTSQGGHDFAAGLDTDPAGNFYYIRAHTGMMRVSADGSKEESIAAGWRNPVGMGVSPEGLVTAAPQEGNWTPASGIYAVKLGGWYGFAGPRETSERPLGYDSPLCWIPREADNSSGGQCWVTSDRWGPLAGRMLHLSYGQCSLLLVLNEECRGVHQGGLTRIPLQFSSGAMRGRFSPIDGQLYVTGTNGWQTRAAYDGCLQRVRYTGRPLDLPVALNAEKNGVRITFSEPLDPAEATNPDNYLVECWNYRYASDYGSREYKPSEPGKFGRDELYVLDAELSDDRRTVRLELEDIAPVMQMQITATLKTADGRELRPKIYNTLHILPE